MSWLFTREDHFQPIAGPVIHWTESADESLRLAGYEPTMGSVDEAYLTLGNWVLYVLVKGDKRLPKYFIGISDGMGITEIWIANLPDLLMFVRLYGCLGKDFLKG